MTRVRRSDATYRGVSTPTPVAKDVTPALRVPLAPLPPIAASTPARTLRTYPASKVLSGVLMQHNPLEVDGPGHASRLSPRVSFSGITTVRGTLPLYNRGKNLTYTATSAIGIAPGGVLFIPQAMSNGHGQLMSAKMHTTGKLELLAMSNITQMREPPLCTENGFVLLRNVAFGSHALTAGGKLEEKMVDNDVQQATLLKGNRFVSVSKTQFLLLAIHDDGTFATLSAAPLPSYASVCDYATAAHGDLIMVTNRQYLTSYALNGDQLEARDHVELAPRDITTSPPIVAHGVVLTAQRTGILHTRRVDSRGTFSDGATLAMGSDITGGLVVRGNIAVFGCADGGVYTVRFDGTGKLEVVDKFETGGAVFARPTITQDGVVLVGSNDAHLYALQLGKDGTLTEKAKKKLDGPIDHAVTLTKDGFTLLSTNKTIYALRG